MTNPKNDQWNTKRPLHWSFVLRHSSFNFADILEIDGLVADFDFVTAFGVVIGIDFDRHARNLSRDVLALAVERGDLLADEAAGRGQALLRLHGLQGVREL